LVTGMDIIFFWVARMTMMAGHFTDAMPFETVYIHGLVRDENKQKMSKTKGNGIDPLVLINRYGTDALRYTLIREVAGAGQDISLEYDRKTDESASVEASGKFANKLWNASRFVMMNLAGQTPQSLGEPEPGSLELCDRWILSRFNRTVQTTSDRFTQYGLGEAAKDLYEFIWGDFCDWYIELVKPRLQADDAASKRVAQQTLAYVLDGILKLLHPFMPHITEEVWHTLTQTGEETCLALQPYPQVNGQLISNELEQQFTLMIGTVRTIRNLRAEVGIKPSAAIAALLQSDSAAERQILEATRSYIGDLAKVSELTITASLDAEAPESSAAEAPQAPPAGAAPETAPVAQSVMALLERPVITISQFYSQAKKPLKTLVLLFALLVVLRILGAAVGTIESIPLLPGLLRLVGIGYSAWFIRQNLWLAGDRRQTAQRFSQFWQQIVGQAAARSAQQSTITVPSTPVQPQPKPQIADAAAQSTAAEPEASPKMIAGVIGTVQVLIPLTGVVDVDALRAKVEKDLGKVEGEIKSLSGRLSNSGFVDKAPAQVVQGARDALAEAQKQAEILRDRLKML
ncbi:MAG: class I tRNA ligase family protein, partial [Cyanobacteria bacterium P01_D01_bin.128]